MAGEKTWFIKIEDSVLGPFTVDNLQEMIRTGELSGDDLIKQDDFGAYSRADTFEAFLSEFSRRKMQPRQEELSIFMNQEGVRQATQTMVLKESPAVKAEVRQALKLEERAARMDGGGSWFWFWVGASLMAVLCVATLLFYLGVFS